MNTVNESYHTTMSTELQRSRKSGKLASLISNTTVHTHKGKPEDLL